MLGHYPLGAASLAGSGSIPITGAAAITEAADTVSSAAAVAITANAAITEASDTTTSASVVAIAADASITEGGDTVSSTATLAIAASASITEDADTMSSSAAMVISASASITEESDTTTSASAVAIAASASITEDSDTTTSASVVVIAASASITEDSDTTSSASTMVITATAAITLATASVSSEADVIIAASASLAESDDTLSSTNTTPILADAFGTESDDTLSAAASVLVAAQSNIALTDLSGVSSASIPVIAAANITLTDLSGVSSASIAVIAQVNIALGAVAGEAETDAISSGQGSAVLDDLSVESQGEVIIGANLAATLSAATLIATSGQVYANVLLDEMSSSSTGNVDIQAGTNTTLGTMFAQPTIKLGGIVVSASASVVVGGTTSRSLGPATTSSRTIVKIGASSETVLSPITLASRGNRQHHVIAFSPVWQTQNSLPLTSTPLNEGSSVSLSVAAIDVGTGVAPYDLGIFLRTPSSAGSITELTLNGSVIDPSRYSMTGRTLDVVLVGLSLSGSLTVGIKRTGVLSYSLLQGELPPGLRLNANGSISGVVTNVIGTTTRDFSFTVRVMNETVIRDRSFVLQVNPVPNETTWVTSRLPFPDTDNDLDVDYYPFGELRRLETKLIPLEGRDEDNDAITIEVRPTGLTGNFIEGLPPGVVLRENILRGTVSSRAVAGRYLFRLGFVGQSARSILGEIKILNANAITTHTPSLIEWLTPENLGRLTETYPSSLKVVAKSGVLSVTYKLAPSSGPLPPGITLNPATGDLQGIAGHIGGEMTYAFTIRATAGVIFADRRFTLTIADRYDTAAILDVRLKLRTTDRIDLMPRYRSLIPRQAIYRTGDRQFGIQAEPFVYLIKGLRGTDVRAAMNGDGTSGPLAPDYHDKFTVLLGKHYGAVARDRTGQVTYEVIYRTILDPQALAGGFKFGTNEAIEERVLYPQANSARQYIYPKSIRNARMDMTRDLKFASSNPALALVTDRDGVEGLPEWMTCRQAVDDPDSVLGYFPALVIGYVGPGEAAPIINVLNANSQLPPPGTQVTFDRYYSFEHITQGGSTFDGGLTTFDTDTTIFDVS